MNQQEEEIYHRIAKRISGSVGGIIREEEKRSFERDELPILFHKAAFAALTYDLLISALAVVALQGGDDFSSDQTALRGQRMFEAFTDALCEVMRVEMGISEGFDDLPWPETRGHGIA